MLRSRVSRIMWNRRRCQPVVLIRARLSHRSRTHCKLVGDNTPIAVQWGFKARAGAIGDGRGSLSLSLSGIG